MSKKNEDIVRRWFDEVWNQKRPEVIDELTRSDVIARGMGPNGTDLFGPAAFRAAYDLFISVFPDLQITVDVVVSSGDKVAAHLTCVATHTGDGLGVPGSGKRVRFPVMTIARIHDGLIAEGWNVLDLLSVLRQAEAVEVNAMLP